MRVLPIETFQYSSRYSSRAGDATVCINSGVSNRLRDFIRDMGVGNRVREGWLHQRYAGF